MFVEFLVVDAQLLLLGLQLLGLPLCFLQQLLKLSAILGRAHGNGNHLRQRREQLLLRLIGTSEKAELDRGVHGAIYACGGNQHFPRHAVASPRADGQVVLRNLDKVQRLIVLHDLSNEAVTAADRGIRQVCRQRIAGEAPKTIGSVSDVNRRDLRPHIRREKAHYAVAEAFQRLITLDALAETHSSRPQPGLQLARPIVAGNQGCGGSNQQQQNTRADPRDARGELRGTPPFLLALRQLCPVGVLDVINERANPVHQHLTAIRSDDRQGRLRLSRPFQINRAEQFIELGGNQSLQLIQPLRLLGALLR